MNNQLKQKIKIKEFFILRSLKKISIFFSRIGGENN
jgi:hypothetical protein